MRVVVVLDTSALIRLYLPEGPIPDFLEESVRLASQAELLLLIPELALAEAAQVLRKKEKAGILTKNEVDIILEAILELPLNIIGHFDILTDALFLARKHDLTVYDSIFFLWPRQRTRG